MNEPWKAEVDLNERLVRKLLFAEDRNLRVETIVKLGEGWDNYVFEVNGELLLRFPKHKSAAELLANEARVFAHLGRYISQVEVPKVLFHGQPSPTFPFEFLALKKIKGRTACQVQLETHDRGSIAEIFALFLRELHDIPLEAIPADGSGLKIDRLDTRLLRDRICASLEVMKDNGYIHEAGIGAKLLDRFQEPNALCEHKFIHGDLYARHLILDENKKLKGVIDWGDCEYADPAIDYQIIFTFFPPAWQARIFDVYGSVNLSSLLKAQWRALMSATTLMSYGLKVNDRSLFEAGRFGLFNLEAS